jgi:hypothetical protein
MRRNVVACLVAAFAALSSLSTPSAAGGPVPARLAHARYVALGYDLGDSFLIDSQSLNSDRILSEERQALSAIRDALETWDQYEVVVRGSQAELVIAIRKGRLLSTGGGVGIGSPGRGSSLGGSVEASSPYDMLSVYDAASGGTGSPGTLLWRRTRPAGTPSSFASMFADFRKEVEKAAKKP